MKVAVEGCCHGHLDEIYSYIQSLETQRNYKVDLLLICGDFQAIRNHADLQCMAVPQKYRALGGFYKYYTGEKTAPILTVVIGGNHEASNYMWELYHGGWVAPNLYFLGHAGCVRVNGVRIAGASGIFKAHDFRQGNYERLPYTPSSLRSIYHIREFSVRRLSLLSQPTIFLSHDWPQSIEQYGNLRSLLSRKSFLTEEVRSNTLGSPPLMGLLWTLKPKWWFAAHMHVKYEAVVPHEPTSGSSGQETSAVAQVGEEAKNPDEITIDDDEFDGPTTSKVESATSHEAVVALVPSKQNPEEIVLEDEEDEVDAPVATAPSQSRPPPAIHQGQVTHFLALDKCLPKRQFLEVIDIPTSTNEPPILEFDPEWLAITRAFHPWFSTNRQQPVFPEEEEARTAVANAMQWVTENLQKNDATCPLPIHDVQVFAPTAPGPDLSKEASNNGPQPPAYSNPQTEVFCRMLDIENKINPGGLRGDVEGN